MNLIFQIHALDSHHNTHRKIAKDLKLALSSKEVSYKRGLLVTLPTLGEHKGHFMGEVNSVAYLLLNMDWLLELVNRFYVTASKNLV